MFDFHLFADDSNLFYSNKDLATLESNINNQLVHISEWLCANKLLLNIAKSNFIIFHPAQKKKLFTVKLFLNGLELKEKSNIRYLGILIDKHLNWKAHIKHLSKKIKRSIGVLSKIRHYIDSKILTNLYYSLVQRKFVYNFKVKPGAVAKIQP